MNHSTETILLQSPDSNGERPCRSIDWYTQGQSRTVEVDGRRVVVRFVGRRGRRARIAVLAPAGADFGVEEREQYRTCIKQGLLEK